MRQISHDFIHALTHVDHSIFALTKVLAIRPGHVAHEHTACNGILQAKRFPREDRAVGANAVY